MILLEKQKAEELAATLNESDESGWTYSPVHPPDGIGLSYVEVRDEDGELIGKF